MDIKNLKLHAYGNLDLRADVEEKLDDIELGVLYSIHGDSYFLVKTKTGETFKYGYFVNLRFENDIDRLGPEYVRKPELFKVARYTDFDHVKWAIDYFTKEETVHYGWRHEETKIYEDAKSAQWHFNRMLDNLEEEYAKGYYYNKELRRIDIVSCLVKNGIDTDENLEKLKTAKLTSKNSDGFDGVAAKKLISYEPDPLTVDEVSMVIRNGKQLDESEWIIIQRADHDPDGFPIYVFPLDQFDKDIVESTRNDVLDEIKNIRNTLNEIEHRLMKADLNKMYSVLDVLNTAYIYWPEDEENNWDDDEEDG